MATQKQQILEHITVFGSITPMEAIREYGITKLATRVSEMRKAGMEFEIEDVVDKNRFGKPVRYCRYSFKIEGGKANA